MKIGEKIAEARKRVGFTQKDLSEGEEVFCSREAIAKYETGKRPFPKDHFQGVAHTLDDPQFYFDSWEETTGYVSIPFFDGDYIDQHPSAMKYMVKKETYEALENMDKVCWIKPVHIRNNAEQEEIKQVIKELLDAAASMINLVAILCREYGFSMRSIFKQWRLSTKAKRWWS
ncbi:transcriptional regulator [Bacillaceae bacterium SAOS 7]|nr:transcriptional regulator [Bacillaceae bacterium SAOS 7]